MYKHCPFKYHPQFYNSKIGNVYFWQLPKYFLVISTHRSQLVTVADAASLTFGELGFLFWALASVLFALFWDSGLFEFRFLKGFRCCGLFELDTLFLADLLFATLLLSLEVLLDDLFSSFKLSPTLLAPDELRDRKWLKQK